MQKIVALGFFALGCLISGDPALAQGATGAVSRPGWSSGQAPNSDFNAQGRPMTRSEIIRQRSAGARAQAAAQPRRGRRS